MNTIKVISLGDGTGIEINPYEKNADLEVLEMYKDFAREHPPLPLLLNGQPFMEKGVVVKTKLIHQERLPIKEEDYQNDTWHDCEIVGTDEVIFCNGMETREVYSIITAPEKPSQEIWGTFEIDHEKGVDTFTPATAEPVKSPLYGPGDNDYGRKPQIFNRVAEPKQTVEELGDKAYNEQFKGTQEGETDRYYYTSGFDTGYTTAEADFKKRVVELVEEYKKRIKLTRNSTKKYVRESEIGNAEVETLEYVIDMVNDLKNQIEQL